MKIQLNKSDFIKNCFPQIGLRKGVITSLIRRRVVVGTISWNPTVSPDICPYYFSFSNIPSTKNYPELNVFLKFRVAEKQKNIYMLNHIN